MGLALLLGFLGLQLGHFGVHLGQLAPQERPEVGQDAWDKKFEIFSLHYCNAYMKEFNCFILARFM